MKRIILLTLLLALAAPVVGPLAAAPVTAPAKRTTAPARQPSKRPVKARLAKPAVPKPPAVPARDRWQDARDMADRGQSDSALVFLRTEIASDSQAFDLRWLEAGLTGKSGDVAGAVKRYEALQAAFPLQARRLDEDLLRWRLEDADARTSIRVLRSWNATHPGDTEHRVMLAGSLARADSLAAAAALYDTLRRAQPDDTELALRHAQILGWMGRHREAIVAYDAILAREPQNAEARFGRATNLNWSGRHRVATHELEQLANSPDADRETAKTLAFARYWDDDPDGALTALDRYRVLAPDDREARQLRERIARERRATLEIGFGRADDSDGLNVTAPSMDLHWPLAMRTTGMLGWHHDLVEDGAGKTNLTRFSAGLRHRLDAAWSVYGRVSGDHWKSGLGTRTGGEFGIISRPIDRLRLEVVTARDPITTRTALDGGHSLLQWVLAADWSGIRHFQLHADARAGYYSDGNRSERTSASARWDAWSSKLFDVTAELGVDQVNTHLDLNHGYYDPDFHRQWGPGVRLAWQPDPRWRLGAQLKSGWQKEKGGLAEAFYGLGGRIAFEPDADWVLALEGGRGDSNLQTAAGYRRTWWQCSVARAF